MRFYAVRTEAIHHTHQALQRLEQNRRGSSGPSRALRVAQLYGHLQCRAGGGAELRLTLRELAAAWHLQPRQLRTDLQDLQTLGWLQVESGSRGTTIRLLDAWLGQEEAPAGQSGPDPVTTDSQVNGRQASSREAADRLRCFAELYNRHRPPSWPSYSPRSSALRKRLERAVAQAGGEEALWRCLERALNGMPPFWRSVYPQGRSGAECAAALFSVDRRCTDLGVEFWHVFLWSQAGSEGGDSVGGSGAADGESDLARATRLLLWDGHRWRGQGVEALKLAPAEKRRLAELLEQAGHGIAGTAAEQFATA